MTNTTSLPTLIGTKINHGSPGYFMNKETITAVTFLDDRVELEFKSEFFTQMTHEQYEYMLRA